MSNTFFEDALNVKYPEHELPSAVGDGIVDDYSALQDIIDYAFNHHMVVYFPPGDYKITKPLLLKTNYEATPIPFWNGNAIKIIGFDYSKTRIIKEGEGTLSDVNSQFVNGKDSTIILYGENSPSPKENGTGIGIENLSIINNSTTPNALAITGTACQRMILSRLNIKSKCGIRFNECYGGNIFEQIVFRCEKEALWLTAGEYAGTSQGTSNTLINIYASRCLNPYKIYAAYTNLITVFADNCTGTVFQIDGAGIVMNGCGTESPEAQYIVESKSAYTMLNITSLYMHRQSGLTDEQIVSEGLPGQRSVFFGNGSIKVDQLYIYRNTNINYDINTYLYNLASVDHNYNLDIGNIVYSDRSSASFVPLMQTGEVASSAKTTGKMNTIGTSVMLRRNTCMPYIGSRNISDSIDHAKFIDKAIYLDNDTTTSSSKFNDMRYSHSYNVGDILIINDPKKTHKLGYIVTDKHASINEVGNNQFAEIPIALSGSSADRPKWYTYVGMQYFDITLGKPIWVKKADNAPYYQWEANKVYPNTGLRVYDDETNRIYRVSAFVDASQKRCSGLTKPVFDTNADAITIDNNIKWQHIGTITDVIWVDSSGSVV